MSLFKPDFEKNKKDRAKTLKDLESDILDFDTKIDKLNDKLSKATNPYRKKEIEKEIREKKIEKEKLGILKYKKLYEDVDSDFKKFEKGDDLKKITRKEKSKEKIEGNISDLKNAIAVGGDSVVMKSLQDDLKKSEIRKQELEDEIQKLKDNKEYLSNETDKYKNNKEDLKLSRSVREDNEKSKLDNNFLIFFKNIESSINKKWRYFNEETSEFKKNIVKYSALAGLLTLGGLGLNHQFNKSEKDDISKKDNIENTKKENLNNNKKDTLVIEKKVENTQEIKGLGIRFKNGIQYKKIGPNNWQKLDKQYNFSEQGIEASKGLREDLYLKPEYIDGEIKVRYYHENGDLYTGSADDLYKK